MARRTLADLFDEARAYLDTDDLNFPDDLCVLLMRRVWFQAVNMEVEWEFLLTDGTATWGPDTERIPMAFTATALAGTPVRNAARLGWVRWGDSHLAQTTWDRATLATRLQVGTPYWWAEERDAGVRYLRVFPTPSTDPSGADSGTVYVSFVLIPEFPTLEQSFVDLPEEFDDALLHGLVAEMYMREEDADLYQFARSMFMEQMGSIKERWRRSVPQRLQMASDALVRTCDKQYRQPRLTDSGW